MPRKPLTEFFEDFTFKKTKKKGRTTVISINWGSRVERKKWGFRSYEKTVTGGGKRPYNKTVDLNDEENPRAIATKLLNIRRAKK